MIKNFLELFDINIKRKFSYLPNHNKQMRVFNVGGIVLIDSGFHSDMFNILYSNEITDRASVKSAIDYFHSKKLPYAFWIGFESDPSWLEEELLTHGLVTDEKETTMLSDLRKQDLALVNSNFDIRQVQDPAGIQDLIYVMNDILPFRERSAIRSFYEQSASVLLSKDSSLTFFVGYEHGESDKKLK